ncbi:MAG TPA: hypothetical protein VKB46_02350 [Pyrinomonadaceae bacterium]|nr:hypothetical protein [Pyrinomonadaceae bacterium]
MKRSLSVKFLVLTLTVLVGSLAVTATERPFSANGKGIATPIFDDNGNLVGVQPTGSGTATHLGLFTNTGKVIFTPDASNRNILHPTGEGVFTAANGDKVNFIITGGDLDVTTGIGTGIFEFTGGTGRFANATGRTTAVVEQNFVTGAYEITLVGNIDY